LTPYATAIARETLALSPLVPLARLHRLRARRARLDLLLRAIERRLPFRFGALHRLDGLADSEDAQRLRASRLKRLDPYGAEAPHRLDVERVAARARRPPLRSRDPLRPPAARHLLECLRPREGSHGERGPLEGRGRSEVRPRAEAIDSRAVGIG